MAIHILDKHTAELIAAGEVVERPASVVKELMENAIDAGAHNVTVEIERGGVALIRVADDGSGIAGEDIALAFVRHATSKVSRPEDLEAIGTLGFRGEALASIASVARVELLTRTQQDEFAALYELGDGGEGVLQPAARPVGTTIAVKQLFYNTPARMKFLKKDASEGGYVTETVTRLALSHPEVSVRYVREGKEIFATPGDGDLAGAAYAVLGREFARSLLPVNGAQGAYRAHGLVTLPRAARGSRSMQFFFINGRFVKNRMIMAALEQAYRGMLMQGRFPGGLLFLEMPPEAVDVNVHPAKTEVRFARENEVFDAVYRAVKGALVAAAGEHGHLELGGSRPAASEPETGLGGGITGEGGSREGEKASAGAAGRPVETRPLRQALHNYDDMLASSAEAAPYERASRAPGVLPAEAGLSMAPADEEGAFAPAREASPIVCGEEEPLPGPEVQQLALGAQAGGEEPTEELVYVGEVFKTYVLAQKENSLCLIDKHAAHERILYEQLAAARQAPGAQQLLQPVTVGVSAAEKEALLANGEALAAAGVEIEDFGGNSVLLRSVPADIAQDSLEDLVLELGQKLALNGRDTLSEKSAWVLHSVACRAAVKAGDYTTPQELLHLAGQILAGEVPPFCPHGRPVVLEITKNELEKQFGRQG